MKTRDTGFAPTNKMKKARASLTFFISNLSFERLCLGSTANDEEQDQQWDWNSNSPK